MEIQVDSEDHYAQVTAGGDGFILALKPMGRVNQSPKTESTSGSKNGDFSLQNLKKYLYFSLATRLT